MANDAFDPGPNGDYPYWSLCPSGCGKKRGTAPYNQKVGGNTRDKVLIKFTYPEGVAVCLSEACTK